MSALVGVEPTEPDARRRPPVLRHPATKWLLVAVVATLHVVLVLVIVPGNFRLRDLDLRVDDRVDIVAPRDGARVGFPLTISWREHEPVIGGADGTAYFAVFVDRPPIKPGDTLKGLIDKECEGRVATPCAPGLRAGDARAIIAHLAENGVHVTKETSLTIERLADAAGSRTMRTATIVLLDRWARRVGEAAYSVEFAIADDGEVR